MLDSIMTALSAIQTATEIGKIIVNSSSSYHEAEFKLKMAELISALANAKINIAETQENLLKKDNEIRQLKELLSMEHDLVFEAPYYWQDKEGIKDGPFCSNCWESNKSLIHLMKTNMADIWECPKCKNEYSASGKQNRKYIRAIGIKGV